VTGPVLVTGAAGCVGRAVVERLAANGHDVVGLDLAPEPDGFPGLRWIRADLTEPGACETALDGIGTVIHLAAKVHSVPRSAGEAEAFRRVNVAGTEMLLDAAIRQGAGRFLLASTVAVLAKARGGHSDAYADSKRAAEAAVLRRRGEIGVVIARPTTVYGPHDRGNVCRLIRWIDRGLPPFLGDGSNRKSLVFVRNLAAALELLADRGADAQPYVVADVPAPTMAELAEAICRSLGRRNRWPRIPAGPVAATAALAGRKGTVEKMTEETVFDASPLHDLGFTPPCPFDEAIAETVRWCRSRRG
jgi:nucleoside-diphosphate-sugar epimerase